MAGPLDWAPACQQALCQDTTADHDQWWLEDVSKPLPVIFGEGLLLWWRDAAGVPMSTSIGGGLYFGVPQLVRAVAAERLADGERSQQLRQKSSPWWVTSST